MKKKLSALQEMLNNEITAKWYREQARDGHWTTIAVGQQAQVHVVTGGAWVQAQLFVPDIGATPGHVPAG